MKVDKSLAIGDSLYRTAVVSDIYLLSLAGVHFLTEPLIWGNIRNLVDYSVIVIRLLNNVALYRKDFFKYY